MIILLSMLYAFLASGGYLQSFGSWENITSGIFNFQNSDATTSLSITMKPIQKQVAKDHNKMNSRRVIQFRHFNNKNYYNYFVTRSLAKSRIPIKQRQATKTAVRVGRKNNILPTIKTTTTVRTISQYNDTIEIVEIGDQVMIQSLDAVADTTSTSTDTPLPSTHITKYIDRCPAEGFFFKKDLHGLGPEVCYLCFCKENTSAVCWPRDNKKCDAESYEHNVVKKRVSRNRRSFDFGNLFMQDAARDALNANGKKQCKPGEASYSVGCPPEDWCVGCTVCDCDINAKWNCHLLSFCTDDNKNQPNKKRPQTQRPFYDPFTTPKAWRAQRKLAQQAVQKLAEKMAMERKKKEKQFKDSSRRFFFKNGTLVNKTLFDLRKRKKSYSILDDTAAIHKFNDLNMKIRKIPDEIQRQMMEDRQQNNARKVSESANFLVRNIPNKKVRQNIIRKQAQAVYMLAKREPARKKKRQVILPSGYKLPKEILDKLPEGVIPPSKDPPGKHFAKKTHEKRDLEIKKRTVTAKKPPRKIMIEKKQVKKSIPLPTVKGNKVLVKRSTKLEQVSKNSKVKKQDKRYKDHHTSKQTTKTAKVSKPRKTESKSRATLKEKSEARFDMNTKRPERRNKKTLKPERRNIKINKNNTHTHQNRFKSNIMTKMGKTKRTPKQMKILSNNNNSIKNLKNNIFKNMNNDKKNKINKLHQRNKVHTKKPLKNETKRIKSNNNKYKRAFKTDKNVIKNKTSTKLGKSSKITSNKLGPKFTRETKSTKEKRSQNAKTDNIDRKHLNEEIVKLTTNAQANLNKKVLEAVGKMIGQDLYRRSKKVKRSAPLKIIHQKVTDDIVNDSSIEFPPPVLIITKKNKKNTEESVEWTDIGDDNQTFISPLIEFPGQKVKRFAKKNDKGNESQDFIAVKKMDSKENNSGLKDVYVPTEFKNKITSSKSRIIKRSSPVIKKVVMKKSVQHDKRNRTQSFLIPIKKSQKISVDKSNKVKVKRNKRGANPIVNLEDVENDASIEITRNSSRVNYDIKIQENITTTESITDYYKYTVDDLNKTFDATKKKYLKEIVEVYSKSNVAAKRSVDNQILSSVFDAHKMTETIFVKGLREKNIDTIANIMEQENVNKTVLSYDEGLKIQPKNLSVLKPSSIIDDKVVMIEKQNISSTDFASDQSILPISKNDSNFNLKDITVIGVEENNNKLIENTIKETNTETLQDSTIQKSGTVVDTSIVIINDQNTPFTSTNNPFSLSTENNLALIPLNITNFTTKPALNSTTENTNVNEIKNNLINVNKSLSDLVSSRSIEITTSDRTVKTLLDTRKNNKYMQKYDETEKEYQIQSILNKFKNKNDSFPQKVSRNLIKITNNETITTSSVKSVIKESQTEQIGYLKTKTNLTGEEKSNVNVLRDCKFDGNKSETGGFLEQQPRFNLSSNIISLAMTHPTTTLSHTILTEKSTLYLDKHTPSARFSDNVDKSTVSTQDQNFNIETNISSQKSKFKSNEIKKVRYGKIGKHKLKKMLTTLHDKKNKDERQLISNNEEVFNKSIKTNKTKDLRSFFKKFLSGFKFNKHARKPSNVKRLNILKYLQKYFKKIFAEGKKNKKNKTKVTIDRKTVIETLCSTFGPCNNNIKNKAKLQFQLDRLNSETYKMLRSIKIIKGLLKLIDIPNYDRELENHTDKRAFFKNDVQKLHLILKEKNVNQFENLTDTQKQHMMYIKNNTQYFIQAAAKFTMVLNEIINVITVPNYIKNEEHDNKSRVELNNKNDTKKIFKLQSDNKTIALADSNESLQKLKDLISRYSLMQNTFMRKIYSVLTNLNSRKENSTNKNKLIDPTITTKTDMQNKTEEIQVYTKNIIQNLRKLKNLAQNLNRNMRRKRDLRYDDSLEYLLMLMEYLLKQKSPQDPPVNDGIDILIEAIKNSPDINDIKKKLPPHLHLTRKSTTVRNIQSVTLGSLYINSAVESRESNSGSENKSTKEHNSKSSNSEDKTIGVNNKSIDDDDDEKDYYVFGSKKSFPSEVKISTTLREFTNKDSVTYAPEYTTETQHRRSSVRKTYALLTADVKKEDENFLNKFVADYEVGSLNTVTELEYTTDVPENTAISVTLDNVYTVTSNPLNEVNDETNASKSRLEWIDETYEDEIKEKSSFTPKNIYKISKQEGSDFVTEEDVKNEISTKRVRNSDNVKKFTKLTKDKSAKKAHMKEILYEKQLDMLNSLDYGTGKVDVESSASKESGVIDKYASGSFATYS